MRHLLHKTYPTGRKHCTVCKRWRPVTDFSVRKWWDIEREIPQTLQAKCKACANAEKREGRPPRKVGHDANACKKASMERMKKDPMRLAQYREYNRIYQQRLRRAQGAVRKPTGPKIKLDVGIDGYWIVEYEKKRVPVDQGDAVRNVERLVVKRERFVPVQPRGDEGLRDCA